MIKITTPLLDKKSRDATHFDYFTITVFFFAALIIFMLLVITSFVYGGVFAFFGWLIVMLAFGYYRGVVRVEFVKKEEVKNEDQNSGI